VARGGAPGLDFRRPRRRGAGRRGGGGAGHRHGRRLAEPDAGEGPLAAGRGRELRLRQRARHPRGAAARAGARRRRAQPRRGDDRRRRDRRRRAAAARAAGAARRAQAGPRGGVARGAARFRLLRHRQPAQILLHADRSGRGARRTRSLRRPLPLRRGRPARPARRSGRAARHPGDHAQGLRPHPAGLPQPGDRGDGAPGMGGAGANRGAARTLGAAGSRSGL
ncbi:MAG: Tetraacyldisaccharide 4'-kinase, partial [uncultured Acetobacteraceae bacterium]